MKEDTLDSYKDAWLKNKNVESSYYTADIGENNIVYVLSDTCNAERSVLSKVLLSHGG